MNATALCVEDDDNHAYLLERRLARLGIAVHRVASAEAGLDALAARAFDFVLLDLNLPGMDGWAFLERLRRKPCAHAAPVIVLSAHVLKDEAEHALAAGAVAFLPKPIDFARLRRVIGGLPAAKRALGEPAP